MSRHSRLIGEAEFAAVYAAAEFAAEFHLWFDTTVTLSWKLLDCTSDEEVLVAFTAFQKCLRAWLGEQKYPVAYLYAHECGVKLGLHTHLILYVPSHSRKLFRAWVRGWAARRYERKTPYALRVRGPTKETSALHWMTTSYLLKGYDRDVVVQSARYAPDGRPVMLGDLVAFNWADPGQVTLHQRVGSSRSLGPDRRKTGVPTGFDYLLPRTRAMETQLLNNLLDPQMHPLSSEMFGARAGRHSQFSQQPFRSSYEDGVRDARQLFPPEFYKWVTRLEAVQASAQPRVENTSLQVNDREATQRMISTLMI